MIWRKDEPTDPAGRDGPATTTTARSDKADERGRTGVQRMAEQGGEVTIVGQGARLEGTVVSAGSLRIDGQVKGQINAEGDVLLSPQSQVEADIRAQNVVVAGRFKGGINVKGPAELARSLHLLPPLARTGVGEGGAASQREGEQHPHDRAPGPSAHRSPSLRSAGFAGRCVDCTLASSRAGRGRCDTDSLASSLTGLHARAGRVSVR